MLCESLWPWIFGRPHGVRTVPGSAELVLEASLATWPAATPVPRLNIAMVSAGTAADMTIRLLIPGSLGDTAVCVDVHTADRVALANG